MTTVKPFLTLLKRLILAIMKIVWNCMKYSPIFPHTLLPLLKSRKHSRIVPVTIINTRPSKPTIVHFNANDGVCPFCPVDHCTHNAGSQEASHRTQIQCQFAPPVTLPMTAAASPRALANFHESDESPAGSTMTTTTITTFHESNASAGGDSKGAPDEDAPCNKRFKWSAPPSSSSSTVQLDTGGGPNCPNEANPTSHVILPPPVITIPRRAGLKQRLQRRKGVEIKSRIPLKIAETKKYEKLI